MREKGGNRAAPTKKLKKAFQRCPNVFQKFSKTHEEINIVKISKKLFIELHLMYIKIHFTE